MWPLMRTQGPPKKHKNHLRLNKLATSGANNFLSKRDSEHFFKSKLEYKFQLYTYYPKKVMGFQSLKKSQSRHASAEGGGLE